jgi:hypothetical protein
MSDNDEQSIFFDVELLIVGIIGCYINHSIAEN